MIQMSLIWSIFILIFLLLSIFYFIKSTKKVSDFEITSRPGDGTGSVSIFGTDIDQPINDFVKDFNEYLRGYNNSSSWQNRLSAMGYLAASLVSFISLLLELEII